MPDPATKPLLKAVRRLSKDVDALSFSAPVSHVYNPLDYAWPLVRAYIEQYARRDVPSLLLGMNPGPWGMAQTGVPFGEVNAVREFLALKGSVSRPAIEHPKRPVQGLDCARSEVSGRRLWGWAADRFGTADAFADHFFAWNYCPLAFLEEGGRNRTPDKLAADEREPLHDVCDDALRQVVRVLRPGRIIGVGAFATKRAKQVFGDELPIDTVLHPSPASPAANRGWAEQAERQLAEIGAISRRRGCVTAS